MQHGLNPRFYIRLHGVAQVREQALRFRHAEGEGVHLLGAVHLGQTPPIRIQGLDGRA